MLVFVYVLISGWDMPGCEIAVIEYVYVMLDPVVLVRLCFPNGGFKFHSHQQCMSIPVAPNPHNA